MGTSVTNSFSVKLNTLNKLFHPYVYALRAGSLSVFQAVDTSQTEELQVLYLSDPTKIRMVIKCIIC